MSFTAPVTGTYSLRFLSTEYAETDIPDSSVDFTNGTTLDMNFNDAEITSATPPTSVPYTFSDGNIDVNLTVNGATDSRPRYFYVKENDTGFL